MARKVAGELLLAAAEENAELEVRRATAERQTSHLSHRLKLESAAHSELQKEYEILQQESMSRQREWESRQEEWESRQQAYESRLQERQQAYESRLQECESKHSARISELTIEHETLKETSARQLQWYRERNEMLEADTIRLREELEATKKQLSAAEIQASIPHVDEHLKGLAEQAVDAEAARGRELAARLEEALRESKEREAEANRRAEQTTQAMSAEGERRARQLRLQLEQLRDAVAARDREALEAIRNQKLAEKQAQSAAESEDRVRHESHQRIEELERRIEELKGVSAERDTLAVKADQLNRLAEAQGNELRRLQDGKAKAKAAAAALKRQLVSERQAHRSAAAHAAQTLRSQAEAAALAADLKSREARAASQLALGGWLHPSAAGGGVGQSPSTGNLGRVGIGSFGGRYSSSGRRSIGRYGSLASPLDYYRSPRDDAVTTPIDYGEADRYTDLLGESSDEDVRTRAPAMPASVGGVAPGGMPARRASPTLRGARHSASKYKRRSTAATRHSAATPVWSAGSTGSRSSGAASCQPPTPAQPREAAADEKEEEEEEPRDVSQESEAQQPEGGRKHGASRPPEPQQQAAPPRIPPQQTAGRRHTEWPGVERRRAPTSVVPDVEDELVEDYLSSDFDDEEDEEDKDAAALLRSLETPGRSYCQPLTPASDLLSSGGSFSARVPWVAGVTTPSTRVPGTGGGRSPGRRGAGIESREGEHVSPSKEQSMQLASKLKRDAKSMSAILLRGAEVQKEDAESVGKGKDEEVQGLSADPLRHVIGQASS